MVLSLLTITFIVPMCLAALLSYTFERVPNRQFSLGMTAVIVWLPIYIWVTQLPNIPPQQAIDWLWIYLFLSSLSVIRASVFGNTKVLVAYQITIFLANYLAIAWPVICYNTSFSSHWLIWLENLLFGLIGVFVVGNVEKGITNKNPISAITDTLYLSLLTGGLGLIVIMTGSLLIGTLSIALSSTYLSVALYSKFSHVAKAQITARGLTTSYGLVLLVLLLSRIYVEVNFITTLFVLICVGLSCYLSAKHQHRSTRKRWIQFIYVICLGAAFGYTVFIDVFIQSSYGCY